MTVTVHHFGREPHVNKQTHNLLNTDLLISQQSNLLLSYNFVKIPKKPPIHNMAQPDFQQLSASLLTASQQIGLLPNMPVIDHGAQFLAQLQQNQVNNEAFQRQVLDQMQQMQRQMLQMQGQMRDVQAQMQTMQRDMNAGFDGLSIRMDSMYASYIPLSTSSIRLNVPTVIETERLAISTPRLPMLTPRYILSSTPAMRRYPTSLIRFVNCQISRVSEVSQ